MMVCVCQFLKINMARNASRFIFKCKFKEKNPINFLEKFAKPQIWEKKPKKPKKPKKKTLMFTKP
jgi:hypothetical protein